MDIVTLRNRMMEVDVRTSEQMDVIMEPLKDVVDDALKKIRTKDFDDSAIEEFGKTLTDYLSITDNHYREIEHRFIVHIDKVVRQFVEENENDACSALLLVYKAMSVMQMAAFFSQESKQSDIVVPRYNIACQHLTSYLFWLIYEQMHYINMVTVVQLFTDLKMLAEKNIEVKPAFCFILCTDLSHMCRRFSFETVYMPHLLGELCLLQAKSALNGKALDVSMKHCKHAEENIFNYENSDGFLIWAKALELKGHIPAAFEKAQFAVKHSRNEDERQRLQAYCDTFRCKMKGVACSIQSGDVDEAWLEGTNAYAIQKQHDVAKAVQDSHIPRKKFSKQKRKRTDSNCSILSSNSNNNGDGLQQVGDLSTWTSERSKHISNSGNSSGFPTSDPLPQQQQQQPRQGPLFNDEDIERFLSHQNWDSSSSEDEDRTNSEPDDPIYHEDSESDDDKNIKAECENETSYETWFEESKDAITNMISNENNPRFCIGSGMNLDEKDVAKFCNSRSNANIKRRPFYKDFTPEDNLHNLLKKEPGRYKRCKIELESAHKATCKVIDSDGLQSDIEIAGRSKCGQCFNDDEVVVEILFNPQKGSKHNISDSKPFGQVVGILDSHFKKNSQNPILACTSNEIDGWLMRPLCKSIPKIHVVNTVTKTKSPNLVKYRIDIYELVDSKLKYKGKFNINPALRGQYVFIVVYLGWGSKHVYPLGAVLEVLECGKDFSSGLRILEMQYKVPSLFPDDTISQTQAIIDHGDKFDASGREDKTNDLVFTIDPPQSKDLDDALSIYKQGNNYVVGVHIADVASVVKKDDAVDREARKRAVSFYVQNKRTHNMLPEPLSQDICSLVPDIKRPALSVFLTFNPNGKLVKTIVKKTVIKSTRKFSYEEVQNIIDNEPNTESSQLKSSIIALNNLAQKIREERLKDARFSMPFEDVRFCDMEEKGNCDEAHALVEEFMIKTNAAVAKILKERFSKYLPLRCQTAPATEDVYAWLKKESRIVDVLVHLQGTKVLPNMVISASEGIRKCAAERTEFIPIQSDIWKSILESLEKSRFNEAEKMICTDEIHPLQNVGWIHWIKLLDIAEYRCSGVISDTKANHFSLDIQPYIHFTSPIRRYVDLVSHRLVHAILSGDACPYTVDDIQQICDDVNEATSRQKAFDRSCKMLAKTEKMGKNSVVFHAIVDDVTENGLELSLPGLCTVPSKCREIRFCLLDLSKKPEMKKDTKTDKDLVICQWRKRLYDTTGCPSQAVFNRRHNQQLEQSIVDPNQHTILVRFQDWANILKGIFAKKQSAVQTTVKPLLPTGATDPLSYSKVVDVVTSETGQGSIKNHQCRFSLSFKIGQVVKVQLGASPNSGLLLPQVELVHIAKNLSLCHKHLNDPVGILSKYATRSVKQNFYSIEEYKKAWLPVIEMEAALSAATSELTPIVNNVAFTITSKKDSSLDKTLYIGSFQLSANFCDERKLEFGGNTTERLPEEKSEDLSKINVRTGHGSNDYVCIRCFVPGPPESGCRDVENGMTWIGHGQIFKAVRKEKQSKSRKTTTIGSDLDDDKVTVTFVLNDNSAPPPSKKITGTVEIICKIEVDRRTQHAIHSLKKIDDSESKGKLARAIVLNGKFPHLPKDRRHIAKNMHLEVVGDETLQLPKNNSKQYDAIQNALMRSFSLIQGPPGTGKTFAGIKLIYLYNQINASISTEGGEKCQVLFCGPSNKSVDVVGRYLLDRLKNSCPKLIRMYGSNIVLKDYPIPNRDLISNRNMHDLRSDKNLRDITLHHIIRERGPCASDIKMFDNLFALMLKKNKSNEDEAKISRFVQAIQLKQNNSRKFSTDPERVNVKIIKLYTKLVEKAYTEELKNCEVILCTCSVGGNPRIVKATKIYQCIIDESAMCPEPLAMVPIIATNAKQVVLIGDHKQLRPIIQCPEAAELGMEQSLFERYSSKESILTFLNTQYRMHKEICEFPSTEFYHGKLKTAIKDPEDELPYRMWPNKMVPHVFCHVEGQEEILTVSTEEGNEQSRSNMAEIDKVVQVFRWLIERHSVGSRTIVVLSQYNSQVSALKAKLTEYMDSDKNTEAPRHRCLNVSTVVSSQGSEYDYVIFSTVRSLPFYKIEPTPTLGWCMHNLGFITDANQINVALTRPRLGLIIIGNKNLLEVDKVWKNLLRSYDKKGCLITDPNNFPPFEKPRPRKKRPVASAKWQQC